MLGWLPNRAPRGVKFGRAVDRQPAILAPDAYDAWLDPETPAAGSSRCWRAISMAIRISIASIARLNSSNRTDKPKAGAGEGNRTLVFSLEGCCSTIELHPQPRCFSARLFWHSRLLKATASEAMRWLPARQWWRGLDLNQRRHSQRIYSPSPLTTRAPLRTAAGAMQRGIKAKRPPGQPFREAPYGGTLECCQPRQPGAAG
jgi:hypothetical protein